MLAASCSKLMTTVLVASGMRTPLTNAPHPVQTPCWVLVVVIIQVLDAVLEAQRLLHAESGVGIVAQRVRADGFC